MASGTKKTLVAWVVAVLTVAVWAETFVSTKVLLNRGMFPPDIFLIRFLIAYACMWLVSPGRLFSSSIGDELLFALLGITGGSAYFLLENSALRYSPASNVAILVGSAPLFTALILGLFHKEERMNPKQIAGSFIAFGGMALVVLNGSRLLHISPVGDILAVGAALTWGFYSLILREVSPKYDVRFITRKVFGYGVLTIIPYFLSIMPLSFDFSVLKSPVVWGNLVYLGVVASLLCFLAWNWALSQLGTVRVTNLIYGQCLFTMLIAHMVLGERITLMAVAGTAILIVGMLMAERR